MALPTSASWDIADFNASTLGSLLTLGPGDVSIQPSTSPYFYYNTDFTILTAESRNGVEAYVDFLVGMPSRFTVEFTARFAEMPHNLGDLSTRRLGITLADDAGRGISIYFAATGIAISRVDDFGSVSALPDTADVTAEVRSEFRTIRVAVDGALGRAYVYFGAGEDVGAEIKYIVPVEATPPSTTDRFRLFTMGLAGEPSKVELKTLRVAGSLVVPNLPPVADPGPDRVTSIGHAVRFDGRASFDIEGAPLTYQWIAVDAPFGSAYVTEQSSGATVDDGDSDGYTDTLSFTPNALPAWVGIGDVLLISGDRHIIDAVNNPGGALTVSTDTIPDNLTAIPFRIIRQSLLVGATSETPYIVPDVQGLYRFLLVVNDGVSDSEPAEVLANVMGARAPFGVEPDVSGIWSTLGDEWKLIENRQVFEEAWRGVAQILSGKLLEVWQNHYNYSLRDAQRTYQRKWLAYRTLVAEENAEDVEILPRHGVLRASHPFESGNPAVTGATLVVDYPSGSTPTDTDTVTVTFTASDLTTIIAEINTALLGTGISAYRYAVMRDDATYRYDFLGSATSPSSVTFTPGVLPSWVAAGDVLVVFTGDSVSAKTERFTVATVNNPGGSLTVAETDIPVLSGVQMRVYRNCRLGLKANRAFSIKATSTAAGPLGLDTDTLNYLGGDSGAIVTDRSYYAGDGVDLSDSGVSRYDLLVVANGQSISIDKVFTDLWDPMEKQRVLLFNTLPDDSGEIWAIPSIIHSPSTDYEYQGCYPGDLVKAEVYDTDTNTVSDVLGIVVAQKETRVAADLYGKFLGALLDTTRYEIRFLGVKRRKAIGIAADIISIPQLQDTIPVSASPTLWKETVDYVLEPFYRDVDSAPIPMLQFRDATFIGPDTEPPDVLWAEITVFNNDPNVEDLFGRLVGFTRDDASAYDADFNYVAGVSGLMYSHQQGPSVFGVRVGAQILFGQPFAEVAGVVEEIRFDYSPTLGRLLIRDADGNTPTQSEVVRSYYYKKDPLDTSVSSGLATNPVTLAPWAEGDDIAQFAPIGAGVDVVDLYNTPKWYYPYVRSGLIREVQKFFYFAVRFNLDLVVLTNLSLLFSFLVKVRPTYAYPMLVGMKYVEDDLDPDDELTAELTMHIFESTDDSGRAFMYDDYRGDGSIWSLFDDGVTYYDGIVDCPTDIIIFVLTMVWPGGIITSDSIFFLDTLVTDVLGTYMPNPGDTFMPTYDMNLPAGTYSVTATIKGQGVVLP